MVAVRQRIIARNMPVLMFMLVKTGEDWVTRPVGQPGSSWDDDLEQTNKQQYTGVFISRFIFLLKFTKH